MTKRKTKKYQYHINLNEIDNKKLLLLAGENFSFTEIIEEAIRGKYFSKYKTNEVPLELTEEEKRIKEILDYNLYQGGALND